jgi:hypothetical protein
MGAADHEPPTPPDSPLTMRTALASTVYQALFTPDITVGDEAVDFELPLLGGDPRDGQQTLRLSSFAGTQAGCADLRLLCLTSVQAPVWCP